MIRSMVDPVGSTSASKESAIVAFGRAQRATLSALQLFLLVPKFDEERGSAHRLTSALLLKYTSERHLQRCGAPLRHLRGNAALLLSISSPDSDFSLSGHVPLARPPK